MLVKFWYLWIVFSFCITVFPGIWGAFPKPPSPQWEKTIEPRWGGSSFGRWVWGGLLPLRILLVTAMTQMGPRGRGRSSSYSIFFAVCLWYSFPFTVLPERYGGQPKLEECCWITDIFIWLFISDSILHLLGAIVIKAFNIWYPLMYVDRLKSIFLCSLKLISSSHIIIFFKETQSEIIFCINKCCFWGDRFLLPLSLISTLYLHTIVYLHFFLVLAFVSFFLISFTFCMFVFFNLICFFKVFCSSHLSVT